MNLYQRAVSIFNKKVEPSLNPVVENQADSTANTVAGLVTDFNALLDKLKEAGVMEADSE